MTDVITSEPAKAETPEPRGSRIGDFVFRYGMVVVLVGLVLVATLLYPSFLAPANIRDILSQNAAVGIVAVAMTFVIISGGFDLSVGAIYALAGVTAAGVTNASGSPAVGAVSALVVGILAGLLNGTIVGYFRINPFVATLGTGAAISGLAYVVSNSQPFVVTNDAFKAISGTEVFGVRTSILLLVAVFAVGGLVLSRTVYGRSIYALGGNWDASWLTGLRVRELTASVYVMSGLLAAMAGVLDASRISVGQANVGASLAIDAIAIVVVGGTALSGGEGAIWRTGVGLLILATLTNVFYSLNVSQQWQLIAKGSILVAAVGIDVYFRKRR